MRWRKESEGYIYESENGKTLKYSSLPEKHKIFPDDKELRTYQIMINGQITKSIDIENIYSMMYRTFLKMEL
jgi:hypothetical protein